MKHRWLVVGIGLLGLAPGDARAQGEDHPPANSAMAAKKPAVDLAIRAASIEVAWLRDPLTYPYRLRAEQVSGEDAITITGFVPSEMIRQKAAALAQSASVGITLRDLLVSLPNMALPPDQTAEPNQVAALRAVLEKAVPAVAKDVQLLVDSQGVVTVGGRVDELADRRKVVRALQAIPGCTYVKYDLRMAPSALVTVQAPMLEVPRDVPKEPLVLPTMPAKPPVVARSPAERPAARQGWLTSRTPSPSAQQVDFKPPAAAAPIVQVPAAAAADKPKEPSFLVPSASGLTPPSPAVTLGAPVKGYKSSFLGSGFVMPAAAEEPTAAPSKPPELLKTSPLPPAPASNDAPTLPVVSLPPGK